MVTLDRGRVLAGVRVDEDHGHVAVLGGSDLGERVRVVVGDGAGGLAPQRADGVVEVRVVGAAGAPAHPQEGAVAVLVGARVDALRVGLGVGAEDEQRRRRRDGQEPAVVLEQGYGLLRHRLRDRLVVRLHVHVLVHDARRRDQSAWVQGPDAVRRVGREVGRRVVRCVLAHLIPCCCYSRRHVVQSVYGHRPVEDRPRQFVHPIAVAEERDVVAECVARHRHV